MLKVLANSLLPDRNGDPRPKLHNRQQSSSRSALRNYPKDSCHGGRCIKENKQENIYEQVRQVITPEEAAALAVHFSITVLFVITVFIYPSFGLQVRLGIDGCGPRSSLQASLFRKEPGITPQRCLR